MIGDEVDRVGVGYGKAREVPLAISKAVDDAKKNLFQVPKHGQTITHEVLGRSDAARVLLRPASEGTGVIAGGGVRAVLELAGIRDILAKSLGNPNPINLLKATVNGLKSLRRPEEVGRIRGKRVEDILFPPSRRTSPRSARRDGGSGCRAGAEEPAGRRRQRRKRTTVAKLRITQTRSQIGETQRHRGTLRALGLGRIGKSTEREDSPETLGMLRKVRHLVKVEDA